MANINISDKNTGDQHTAAEYNTVKDFINSPIKSLGVLDPTAVIFTDNGYYSQYTQSGAVVFNVPASVVDGIGQVLYFISDGSNTISFNSSKFHINGGLYGIINGGILAAGLWKIWLFAENGKINVNVPASSPADITGPTITSLTFGDNNAYCDLVVNEGIYAFGTSGPILLADLAFAFLQAGGTATAWTPSSVKQNDSEVEGSASALAGGETTIRIFGAVTGDVDGNETLEVTPTDGASISDTHGNAMEAGETTGAINLSIILMSDNFNDNSIDVLKWLHTVDAGGQVVQAETNQQIEGTCSGVQTNPDQLDSVPALISANDLLIFQVKYTQPDTGNINGSFMVSASPFDTDNRCYLTRSLVSNTQLRIVVTDGGASELNLETGIESGKDVRIKYIPSTGALTFEYWNGAAWTEFAGSASNVDLGSSLIARLQSAATANDANTIIFDDFFASNNDYSTQYPS